MDQPQVLGLSLQWFSNKTQQLWLPCRSCASARWTAKLRQCRVRQPTSIPDCTKAVYMSQPGPMFTATSCRLLVCCLTRRSVASCSRSHPATPPAASHCPVHHTRLHLSCWCAPRGDSAESGGRRSARVWLPPGAVDGLTNAGCGVKTPKTGECRGHTVEAPQLSRGFEQKMP